MSESKTEPCDVYRQGGSVPFQQLADCIAVRVREKKESYRRYNFERSQEEAFATFFDLAQEFTSIESLYQICVDVPKEFFNLDSKLYIIESKHSQLELVCTSTLGLLPPSERTKHKAVVVEETVETDESWFFPIRGNQALGDMLPFLGQNPILGVFEIYPKNVVDERKQFFLEKFTNRIGYNLHQKLLVQQNIDHIKFINQLVSDVEHNVITPNMYYKLFLIRLRKMIENYKKIEETARDMAENSAVRDEPVAQSLQNAVEILHETNQELQTEHSALSKHYEHTSLFLESLFRKDHFQKGTYVLRKQSCNFLTEIIEPLLERYSSRFEKKGIKVDDRLENVPDEQVTLFVDKGLISQVFDNFFSNAIKYTRKVEDKNGNSINFFSLNRQIVKDLFGEGKPGVRFNFFTTGKPLTRYECDRVFEEGFRASETESGTGHGLNFVQKVVEIHGGMVGCEPQPNGNLLYIVLPFRQ